MLPIELGWQFKWQRMSAVWSENTRDFRAAWFYSKTRIDLLSLQVRGGSLSKALEQEAGEESKPTYIVTKDRKLKSIHGGWHGVRVTLFSQLLFRFCSISCELVGVCDESQAFCSAQCPNKHIN